jgi:hypothetical protein
MIVHEEKARNLWNPADLQVFKEGDFVVWNDKT